MNFRIQLGEMPPVIARLASSFRAAVRKISTRIWGALEPEAWSPTVLGGFVTDVVRSRCLLLAENAFLRQQLIVATRSVKRPSLRPHERGLLALLASIIPRWRNALLIVKPGTLSHWHREGFRLFWGAKSRPKNCEPRIGTEVVALIRRMAAENRLWGAERIRGELLKLGIRVAKRTIQRYMLQARARRSDTSADGDLDGSAAPECHRVQRRAAAVDRPRQRRQVRR